MLQHILVISVCNHLPCVSIKKLLKIMNITPRFYLKRLKPFVKINQNTDFLDLLPAVLNSFKDYGMYMKEIKSLIEIVESWDCLKFQCKQLRIASITFIILQAHGITNIHEKVLRVFDISRARLDKCTNFLKMKLSKKMDTIEWCDESYFFRNLLYFLSE